MGMMLLLLGAYYRPGKIFTNKTIKEAFLQIKFILWTAYTSRPLDGFYGAVNLTTIDIFHRPFNPVCHTLLAQSNHDVINAGTYRLPCQRHP